MARVRNQGIPLHGPEEVVGPSCMQSDEMQAEQERHSVASAGMDSVQERDQHGAAQPSDRHRIQVVLPEPRTHLPRAHEILFGIQPLSNECRPVTYDPKVHAAIWQNSEPFVLDLYNRRIKKCRGCGSTFKDIRFVIRHREIRDFWAMGKEHKIVSSTSFYHCNMLCIRPLHPYFNHRAITIAPKTVKKLSSDDIASIKSIGIDI